MSILHKLLRVRPRYLFLGACLLGIVLIAIVAYNVLRGPGAVAGLGALEESDRAWLEEKRELRFAGRWDEAPYGFSDDEGTYLGYEVDLAEALGPILGVGVKVEPMTREEALIALANGEVDGVLGMVATIERSEWHDFTEPYVSSSLSIFVLTERFDVAGLKDLRGHEVAVQADTAALRGLEGEPEISTLLVKSAEEGLQAVVDGRVVALVADEIAGLRAVQEADLGSQVKVVGLPEQTVSYAFAVPKESEAQLNVLNHGLASIEALGLKEQVDREWLGTQASAEAPAASSSTVTTALFVLVLALVLGNGAYFLTKMRQRTAEHTANLEESRVKYQKLVEGTDEAVFTLSGDLGLLEVNNRVETLTGYHRDSLLRMGLDELVAPGQRKSVSDCVQAALRDGSAALDGVSFLDRHGDEVPVRLSAYVVSQADRKLVQCVARDIRERERWRGQVRLRTEYLAALNSIANTVSRSVDIEEMLSEVLAQVIDLTRTQSGIVFLSGSRDGEMALTPAVDQGMTAELKTHLSWPEGPRRLAREVAEAGRVLAWSATASGGESGVLGASGGVGRHAGVPLASRDHVHGVMSVYGTEPRGFTDEDVALLTAVGNQIGVAIENAQLVERLQRTVGEMGAMWRFSQSVLQDMTNGLVVVDRDGKVRLVNQAGESLLGCKEKDVLDSSVEQVLGQGARVVRDSMERQLAYPREEISVRRDGGESEPVGMSVSPLRGEGGKVNGAVVMLRDLSREKRLEEERIRLERLAVLGEMSAVMAHEIRNPLAGMAAGIQHMLGKFDQGDDRHEALERILKEGERVNRIIEDILLISRPPRLSLAPCDLTGVLETLVAEYGDRASAQGVEILTNYEAGVLEVRGDQMRLEQALSNLVANGIEAMPNGGQLRIAARGPVRADALGNGEVEYAEVAIEDGGAGIKEKDLPRIVEPFYSTKARGTGLGLPIAKRIIEAHEGDLRIESREGEGTKVTVRIPLSKGAGR
jgi:PAS domain S-box-containing protein